jgi:predicted HTH transcriptional regulator
LSDIKGLLKATEGEHTEFKEARNSLINIRNENQHFQSGLFVLDVPTFDEQSVREAILNAVSHRDYQLGGSVFVRQYPRKLTIESPGGFPFGITEENILDRETKKELLLKHIRQNSDKGSKFGGLREVLPAETRGQLQQFLKELRKEGKIHVIGKTNSARWYSKK